MSRVWWLAFAFGFCVLRLAFANGRATGSGACGFGGQSRAGLMSQYANTSDARLAPQSPVT
ncbi:MAG: hypothetical protein BWK72_04345 [Rhodoferax ferrireducens]|uniref:Biopterin-dependent aromatic amino acid hydroxylase family profile domain-containing protein n=1 Tax=Rhodoferax ferrireducens TaxID=192843 RepID=A0A1W9KX22_9BURK|nr:MAG: hypothetical protein BWK72_04345 [Rhodoferax ferrireducens]